MAEEKKKADEEEIIEPEVIPPEQVASVKKESEVTESTASEKESTEGETAANSLMSKIGVKFHFLSGLLIFVVDFAFFGAELSIFATPFAPFLAFFLAFVGVFLIQRHIAEEKFGKSLAKAFFSGVVAGVPTFVCGTVVGSAIMALCGVDLFNKKQIK